MELQFYGPGYVPQFEGFGCAARAVLRGDDDRQPRPRPEQRVAEHGGLRRLHSGRGGADQLGVHHEERLFTGTCRPLFTGTSRIPNFAPSTRTSTKDLLMSPGDWINDPHARHERARCSAVRLGTYSESSRGLAPWPPGIQTGGGGPSSGKVTTLAPWPSTRMSSSSAAGSSGRPSPTSSAADAPAARCCSSATPSAAAIRGERSAWCGATTRTP